MPSRDFSAGPSGRRLRLTIGVYHPPSKQFRHVKGVSARVTVKNVQEQARLWRAIEKTIESEVWRVPDGGDTAVTADSDPGDAVARRAAVGS
jgi:hypothetical protein